MTETDHVKDAQTRKKGVRKFRTQSRRTARYAVERGKIEQEPCQVCGSKDSQLHHPDHEMKLFTFWLCRKHHLAWHEHWKLTVVGVFAEWLDVARACDAVRKSENASG
jgi:hypothetical protein